jgi:hypothetical protein
MPQFRTYVSADWGERSTDRLGASGKVTFGSILHVEEVLQFGTGIATVVSRNEDVPERDTVLEPKRLRFFETFGVKFRLLSVGQSNPARIERKKIGE